MARLALRYPGYGWEHNAGYATRDHVAGLRELGVTRVHRRTYQRIRAILEGDQLALRPDGGRGAAIDRRRRSQPASTSVAARTRSPGRTATRDRRPRVERVAGMRQESASPDAAGVLGWTKPRRTRRPHGQCPGGPMARIDDGDR